MLKIGKFYRTAISVILLLLIIFLLSKVQFIFSPFIAAFNVVFIPLLASVFFYYLLRPLVNKLHHWKLNKATAILLIYGVVTGLLVGFFIIVWPTLQAQITGFINNTPQLIKDLTEQLNKSRIDELVQSISVEPAQIYEKISEYLTQGLNAVTVSISNAVSIVTNFVIVITTIPLLLYYLLKEDKRAYTAFLKAIPKRYRDEMKETLKEIDHVLSGFILGRVTLCFLLGVIVYIGFLIIDLPYSLLLASIVAILNIIPYIGSILGTIPAIIIGFIESPMMSVWVLIIVVLANQIEGNLLSPHIYGRSLNIHPFTTILLLLASGTIGGILGILIVIPTYLIIKIIITKVISHYVTPET